jgi:glycosyltransferase involved in cell wall biosynthesis
MKVKKRLNVLLTAHEISPDLGSECSSGWNVVVRLGSYHNITILHAETNQFGTNNYKEHINNYLEKNGPIPGLKFISIKQPLSVRFLVYINKLLSSRKTSVGLSLIYFIGVKQWEKRVFTKAKHLLREEKFDLIHHFNHLSFREPGFLWKLNIPFYWGPTSGLSHVPLSFLKSLPYRELVYNLLRNFMNSFQFKIDSRIRKAIKRAHKIYFVTAEDEIFFSKFHSNISNVLDMGGYKSESHKIGNTDNTKIKILWVGRFSFLKALNILLDAIGSSEILKSKLEVYIIGDGPEKSYYEDIANKHNLLNIHWCGLISKNEVFEFMLESDILVHTSIKEAASAVILESLSAGLPVICHDAFGMKYAVNDNCGIKIPFESLDVSIRGFKEALEKICLNPELIPKMKAAALLRANELTWESISIKIAEDYYEICDYVK